MLKASPTFILLESGLAAREHLGYELRYERFVLELGDRSEEGLEVEDDGFGLG